MRSKFFRDPFFHFFLVGLVLYLMTSYLEVDRDDKAMIKLSKQEIEALNIKWQESWGRAASSAELESVMIKKLQDEKLFSEAIAMGLHKEDSYIYERLISKVRKLLTSSSHIKEPDSQLLEDYYKRHKSQYSQGGRYTFSHVFISIEHASPMKIAKEMSQLLNATEVNPHDIDAFGDSFDEKHITKMNEEQIDKLFGKGFYKQLRLLKLGRWSEPVISTHGMHLIFISEHSAGMVMAYDKVKDIVKRDYMEASSLKFYNNKLKDLMQ